jgi:general secretion pathway protein E
MLTAPFVADLPQQVQTAAGCLECRMTGYYGRIGLYEIMTLTAPLRHLIHSASDDAMIRDLAYKEGMKPLRVSGAMKIAQGFTTPEEVVKVVPLL